MLKGSEKTKVKIQKRYLWNVISTHQQFVVGVEDQQKYKGPEGHETELLSSDFFLGMVTSLEF